MNGEGKCARALLILALLAAASIAGCHDPAVGSIDADRGTVEKQIHSGSDSPNRPSKSARKRPSFDDVSPRSQGLEKRP